MNWFGSREKQNEICAALPQAGVYDSRRVQGRRDRIVYHMAKRLANCTSRPPTQCTKGDMYAMFNRIVRKY